MNDFKESLKVDKTTEQFQEGQTVGEQLTGFLCGDPNNRKVKELIEKMLDKKEDIEK